MFVRRRALPIHNLPCQWLATIETSCSAHRRSVLHPTGARWAGQGRASGELSERTLDAPKRSRKNWDRSDGETSRDRCSRSRQVRGEFGGRFVPEIDTNPRARAPAHLRHRHGCERPRLAAPGPRRRFYGGVAHAPSDVDTCAGALTGRHKYAARLGRAVRQQHRLVQGIAAARRAQCSRRRRRDCNKGPSAEEPRLGLVSPSSAPLLERIDDLETLEIVEARQVLGVERLDASF